MKVNDSVFQNTSLISPRASSEAQAANPAKINEQEQSQHEQTQAQPLAQKLDKGAVLGAMDELSKAASNDDNAAKVKAQQDLQAQLKGEQTSEFNAQFLKDNAQNFASAQRMDQINSAQFAALLA